MSLVSLIFNGPLAAKHIGTVLGEVEYLYKKELTHAKDTLLD